MTNLYLTDRKGAYCGTRGFFRGAATDAGDGISAPWKFSLSELHY